jgi:RsiW-degrading membrane proteinase PrsW (M82 family)
MLFLPLFRLGLGAVLFWACGVVWLFYFRARAEMGSRKPLLLRLAAIGGGYASAFLGLWLFQRLEMMGVAVEWTPALRSSMLIGAVEESSKLLPVLLFARLGRSIDRPWEGLLFAACAGIGFAGAEGTVMWMHGDLSWTQMLARAAAAPLTHALFSIPWGLGLTSFLFLGKSVRLLAGLATSVVLHGTYDWVLASPNISQLAAAFGVMALWMIVLREAPRMAAQASLRVRG